jgi:hypothetical protein
MQSYCGCKVILNFALIIQGGTWEGNIEVDCRKTGCKNGRRMELAEDCI